MGISSSSSPSPHGIILGEDGIFQHQPKENLHLEWDLYFPHEFMLGIIPKHQTDIQVLNYNFSRKDNIPRHSVWKIIQMYIVNQSFKI
jgi:hypothetical protein